VFEGATTEQAHAVLTAAYQVVQAVIDPAGVEITVEATADPDAN
jgi:hypothetical protein